MTISRTCRNALGICTFVAMLAGCGGSQLAPGAPSATNPAATKAHRVRPASSYRVIYRFGGGPRAARNPYAALTDVKGVLYGTTIYGGSASRRCARQQNAHCGTVFSITTSGVEKVLHDFGVGSDGGDPWSSLLNVDGTLYGTTEYGGANCEEFAPRWGCGTLFEITTSGVETVLHSFYASDDDGAYPVAGLTKVKDMLYGTTEYGGATDFGVVFKSTTSGTLKDIYSFQGGSDGQYPEAGLAAVKGMLYGTTSQGGESGDGTVFAISPSGAELVLHSFAGGADGAHPLTGLLDVDGMLYGTTSEGGASNHGTVFAIGTSGSERVLYSFSGGADGAAPDAGLIDVNGTLYGTTDLGGTGCAGSGGCGTVYSITTAGKESVLYSFQGGADGSSPNGLLDVNGTLYGTTAYGGRPGCNHNFGCGTVFALTP